MEQMFLKTDVPEEKNWSVQGAAQTARRAQFFFRNIWPGRAGGKGQRLRAKLQMTLFHISEHSGRETRPEFFQNPLFWNFE